MRDVREVRREQVLIESDLNDVMFQPGDVAGMLWSREGNLLDLCIYRECSPWCGGT